MNAKKQAVRIPGQGKGKGPAAVPCEASRYQELRGGIGNPGAHGVGNVQVVGKGFLGQAGKGIGQHSRLSQILQGSNVPTFVLNQDRVITHWNQALERLTGYAGSRMVGTRRQWVPFWDSERPSMADLILDQKSDQEIWDLYGGKWKKSELIEGAYEAEGFFPNLGKGGRWCWFTAAPIKAADGSLVPGPWNADPDCPSERTRILPGWVAIDPATFSGGAFPDRLEALLDAIVITDQL